MINIANSLLCIIELMMSIFLAIKEALYGESTIAAYSQTA